MEAGGQFSLFGFERCEGPGILRLCGVAVTVERGWKSRLADWCILRFCGVSVVRG